MNDTIGAIDSMLDTLKATQAGIRFSMDDTDARTQVDQFVDQLEKFQNEIQFTKARFNEGIKN